MQNFMYIFLDSWPRGGHMMEMDWGRGFWFFPMGLFGLLPLLALIVLVVWAIRAWSGNRQVTTTAGTGSAAWATSATAPVVPAPKATTTAVETPLDVLQMRYAKGEISRAEYDTIRQDILRDRQMNLVSKAADRESSTATSTSDDVASATDASNNRDENVSV